MPRQDPHGMHMQSKRKHKALGLLAWAMLTSCTCSQSSLKPKTTSDPFHGFPITALVEGTQLVVRKTPSPNAPALGWLRLGSTVRLKSTPAGAEACVSGWREIFPKGYVCLGSGLSVLGEKKDTHKEEIQAQHAKKDAVLPYRYLVVKEPQTPEFYRPPSREDQRAAELHAARYLELLEQDPKKAEQFRKGELKGETARSPEGVMRYLKRGFIVSSTGVEIRSQRRFVRTVRGTYIKEAQLEERKGSEFRGVDLKARGLPVAWVVRPTHALLRQNEEWVEQEEVPRLTLLGEVKAERIGADVMYAYGDGKHLRFHVVTVAHSQERPQGVGQHERWVHVDLLSQTLVVYEGNRPMFATLVSTGLPGTPTPTGLFRVEQRYISDTMSEMGGEIQEQYRIEDVPWVQYFRGSIGFHATLWHTMFGQQRSHGCVNLSPGDARKLFELLAPHTDSWIKDLPLGLPFGWHGTDLRQMGKPDGKGGKGGMGAWVWITNATLRSP